MYVRRVRARKILYTTYTMNFREKYHVGGRSFCEKSVSYAKPRRRTRHAFENKNSEYNSKRRKIFAEVPFQIKFTL